MHKLSLVKDAIERHCIPQNSGSEKLSDILERLACLPSQDRQLIASIGKEKTIRKTFSAYMLYLGDLSWFVNFFNEGFGDQAEDKKILTVCPFDETFAGKICKIFDQSYTIGQWGDKAKKNKKEDLGIFFRLVSRQFGALGAVFKNPEAVSTFEYIASIDEVCSSMCGAISFDEVTDRLKEKSITVSDEEDRNCVKWYLETVRVKYRKNLTLKAARVECPKCHGKHDEGAECPHCRRAGTALEEAQEAERKGNWKTAKAKAEEVQRIWKGNSDAERIIEAAKAALQKIEEDKEKVRLAEGKIRDALGKNPPDIDKAWASWKEARELNGFTTSKWEVEIRQKEEEKKRLERVAEKMREFDAAWGSQDWEKAKRIGKELTALGEKSEAHWNAEIERHKQTLKQDLGKMRDDALAAFAAALGRNDVAGARVELEKAKDAQGKLYAQFGAPERISTIADAEKKLVELENRLAVEGLRPVRDLAANGSSEGPPKVEVRWAAAIGGPPVPKWRVLRRKKGDFKGIPLGEIATSGNPSYQDKGGQLQIGVDYEYGVVPVPDIVGIGWQEVLKKNAQAVSWSAPVVCLTKLAEDALNGKGEGIEGYGGTVSLWWNLPRGIPPGVPQKATISRSDGIIRDKDVTGKNGRFTDVDVIVGRSYEYVLRVQLGGRDIGTSKTVVPVSKVPLPPKVRNFSLARRNGALLVRWEWPQGLDACIWGVSSRKASSPDEIPKIARRYISREIYEKDGGVCPNVPSGEGPCWITVFGVRSFGEHEFHSEGEGIAIGETVLEYFVENHPGRLFSKRTPSLLTIRSSAGYVPELEIRADKNRSKILSWRGGRVVLSIAAESGQSEKKMSLDGIVSPGEFVRAYLMSPDSANCRLVHPSEFEVK